MVELTLSTMNTGLYEPLIYLIGAVLLAACTVYLVRRYFEKREKLIWLFVLLFSWLTLVFTILSLATIDIISLDIVLFCLYTFLIVVGIAATIGLVMLGYKAFYSLPALIMLIVFILYLNSLSSYNNNIISLHVFWLTLTGNFLGNPWFITLKNLFPNIFGQRIQTTLLLNSIFDPISLLIPNYPLIVLSLCEIVIVLPTTILFYYLAWANRSGRSLGFALFNTSFIVCGLIAVGGIGVRSLPVLSVFLLAGIFLALGIFGAFDKLMKRKTKK